MKITQLKMFVTLFVNINKHYFFEKYQFLAFGGNTKSLIFKGWYFSKSTFLISAITLILHLMFRSDLLNAGVLLLLALSMFIGLNTKDWRLFYRPDFVLAIPITRERFTIVLLGNMVLKLLIENNILLMLVLFLRFAHLPFITLPIVTLIYVAFYAATLTIFFLLQNSTFRTKKIFSIINYVTGLSVFIVFSYFIVDGAFLIIKMLIDSVTNELVMQQLLNSSRQHLINWLGVMQDHMLLGMVMLVMYVGTIGGLTGRSFKYLNDTSYLDREQLKYTVKNFALLRFGKKIGRKLNRHRNEDVALVEKEYSLFANIYRYNFNEYFFVCVADRAFSFLIAMFLLLLKYEYNGSYFLLFIFVALTFLMDITSAMGVKLITNMSFIADYNTLLAANTSGFDLQRLIRAKLQFYYTIKFIPYSIMFVVYNIMFAVLHMPVWLMVFGNIINLLIISVFPKLYLTNNLIYTRMNYRDYEKYLDESKILTFGVKEFYPIAGMSKVWNLLIPIILGATTLFSESVNIHVFAVGIIILLLISIGIVYAIMQRIFNNVMKFIERGEYSADFAKIFKG